MIWNLKGTVLGRSRFSPPFYPENDPPPIPKEARAKKVCGMQGADKSGEAAENGRRKDKSGKRYALTRPITQTEAIVQPQRKEVGRRLEQSKLVCPRQETSQKYGTKQLLAFGVSLAVKVETKIPRIKVNREVVTNSMDLAKQSSGMLLRIHGGKEKKSSYLAAYHARSQIGQMEMIQTPKSTESILQKYVLSLAFGFDYNTLMERESKSGDESNYVRFFVV